MSATKEWLMDQHDSDLDLLSAKLLAALEQMIANPRPATESEGDDWDQRHAAYEAAWSAAKAAINGRRE